MINKLVDALSLQTWAINIAKVNKIKSFEKNCSHHINQNEVK